MPQGKGSAAGAPERVVEGSRVSRMTADRPGGRAALLRLRAARGRCARVSVRAAQHRGVRGRLAGTMHPQTDVWGWPGS